MNRIKVEYEELSKEPPSNISAGPIGSDMMYWEATILGPSESPYAGGIYKLEIIFPINYPFKPPKIRFVTPIYHPNINKQGSICLDILNINWSPVLSITKLLLSICSLLTDPNPDDPLDEEIADLYINNKEIYFQNARNFTLKYA